MYNIKKRFMKRNHLSLRRKAGMLSAMAVGVLLVSSCAQDGFDDESWRSDVTNTQLESPAADDITIEASADGSQTIISWPVVHGAGGYLCSVYDVSNPDDPAVVGGVQDSLVDRCQLVVERAEDTNYMFSITTAGNEELNNAQAATATEVEFTSFTETYASIPAGTDISTWFDQNMPTEDTGEELCFDLEPGEEYTMSKDIDFFDKRITLRTTSKTSPAKITLTGNASLMTSAGLTLKYVDFDCANSTAPFIKMSATPDPDILGVISGTNGYYDIQQPIIINTCNIDNLRGSLYTDNGVKYCVGTWLITNSVVHFNLDGTGTIEQNSLINAYGGHINNFTAQNTTMYNTGTESVQYLLRYNNSGRCNRTGYLADYVNFRNCTFYGFRCSQFCNYGGLAGQATSNYVVTSNIFVDCGDVIARRILGGRLGSASASFSNNTYMNADGTFQSVNGSCAGYDDSGTAIEENPGFADPTNGDFTVSGSAQISLGTGDPRWLPTNE